MKRTLWFLAGKNSESCLLSFFAFCFCVVYLYLNVFAIQEDICSMEKRIKEAMESAYKDTNVSGIKEPW